MPKRKKTTLRDYSAARSELDKLPYTHLVRASSGSQFSIHKTEAAAVAAATRIGGTVEEYTPVQSHYWDGTLGSRYDH